jgi:ABC-type glycerol-3-phosphate transport system substrate-binding protein
LGAFTLGTVMYHGKLFGMPLFNNAKHLFCHENLLKQAGFPHPAVTAEFIGRHSVN